MIRAHTFVFWQPARKCTQSYSDYATQCPAKHDVYSVLSTEGGLNVNIGHIVYSRVMTSRIKYHDLDYTHCVFISNSLHNCYPQWFHIGSGMRTKSNPFFSMNINVFHHRPYALMTSPSRHLDGQLPMKKPRKCTYSYEPHMVQ